MATLKRLTKRRASGVGRIACSACLELTGRSHDCHGECQSILEERLTAFEDIFGPEYDLDKIREVWNGQDR